MSGFWRKHINSHHGIHTKNKVAIQRSLLKRLKDSGKRIPSVQEEKQTVQSEPKQQRKNLPEQRQIQNLQQKTQTPVQNLRQESDPPEKAAQSLQEEEQAAQQEIQIQETQQAQSEKDCRRKVMKNKACFQNRELSWLKFNERVLEEAADRSIPLCERMTFLSIFQSNLDEFFMVRVGSLHDMMLLNNEVRDNKTNMTASEQIDAILKEVQRLKTEFERIYEEVMELAGKEGIRFIRLSALTQEESKYMEKYFERNILPLLSVMIVGKKQPFPFLKNNDIYAVSVLTGKGDKGEKEKERGRREKIGIIPCTSSVFDRMIPLPEHPGCFVLAEELILHFTPKVFQKYHVQSKSLIRITRNADIDADSIADEDLNYRDHMEEVIRLRRKLGPVRMEMTRHLDSHITDLICQNIGLSKERVFLSRIPFDLSFVFYIQDILRKNSSLFYEKRVPQRSASFVRGESFLEQIRKKDVMLAFPFESINPFLNMLHEAAYDPDVVSIKMTLYRLAKHSKIVETLVEAAENGKQIDVLVELKARFDEENNIEWSRRLEAAGCHVIYGIDNLKVHSKLCLITRKSQGKIEYFTQIGTGNYNEKTARLYTDLSLMTANPDIGMEAAAVFQALSLGEVMEETKHLLVAPKCMENKILDLIEKEIQKAQKGEKGYIGVKINSLTDKKIIDKLIEASQYGVKIEMIVRGICCLQSGIPSCTDNIHIISIVGRYLEHSRIYIFGTEEQEKMYISSADFMTRNMVRRVEVAVPIYDAKLRNRLRAIFQMMLQDNVKARVQMPDGFYRKKELTGTPLNFQEAYFEAAYQAARKSDEKPEKMKET